MKRRAFIGLVTGAAAGASAQLVVPYGPNSRSVLGSRSGGYSKSNSPGGNPTQTPTVQIAQLLKGTGIQFQDTGIRNWLGCPFTTVSAFTLTSVDTSLGKFDGSVTGTARMYLYNSAAGVPTTLIQEATNNFSIAAFATTPAYPSGDNPLTFNFANIPLAATTEYALVFHATPYSGIALSHVARNILAGINTSGSTDGVTWGSYTYANYQFYYKIYGF